MSHGYNGEHAYWEPFVAQADFYVPMWKHVHDIFAQNGATNVTWVWCPNVDSYSTRPFDSMYPGSDYVDWVCMDGYNYGTAQAWSSWTSFSSLFRPTYDHLRRTKAGRAVSPIKTGACSACGVSVPTGLVQRVRAGSELVFCSGCGRILSG